MREINENRFVNERRRKAPRSSREPFKEKFWLDRRKREISPQTAAAVWEVLNRVFEF